MKRASFGSLAGAVLLAAFATAWSSSSVFFTANAFVVVNRRTGRQCHSSPTSTVQSLQQQPLSRRNNKAGITTRCFLSTANTTSSSTSLVGNTVDITPIAFGAIPDALPTTKTLEQPQQDLELPLIQLALAGSVTTLFSDIIMHPVDCIKTLQQSDAGLDFTFLSAAGHLWTEYGLAGFYFGFLTYACSDAIGGALKFSVWEAWKQASSKFEQLAMGNDKDNNNNGTVVMVVGWMYVWMGAAVACVVSSILIVPGELLKQQLQMSHYESLPAAVQGIYSSAGVPGFYQGYEGVLYRDIPYTILELGLYDLFKSILRSLKENSKTTTAGNDAATETSSVREEILAGAVTGGITAVMTTPIDVVKTKMMVDAEYAGDSFVQCFLTSVDHHGWTSVFAGVEARVAWILPFVAIYLPTYDFLKRQLYVRFLEQEAEASTDKV